MSVVGKQARSTCCGCILIGLAVLIASDANSQDEPNTTADRVWLSPTAGKTAHESWYPRAITVSIGRITRLDDQQLRLIVQGDEVETVSASDRVLWVESGSASEKEAAALKLFAEAQYAEALRPLIDVLQERPPVWRQQWLSMLAAYAAWQSSRDAIALELVRQLDTRPLPPLVLAYLPIAWSRSDPRPTSADAAVAGLSDRSPAVRIVAASWLVQSPHRAKAIAAIKELIINDDRPTVARLADSLRWRVATPVEVAGKAKEWETRIDALPMVLRVGPTRTLIEKLTTAGESEIAKRLQLSLEVTPPFPHPALTSQRP